MGSELVLIDNLFHDVDGVRAQPQSGGLEDVNTRQYCPSSKAELEKLRGSEVFIENILKSLQKIVWMAEGRRKLSNPRPRARI